MTRRRRRRQWHNQMANPTRGRLAAGIAVMAVTYGLGMGLIWLTRGASLLLWLVGWLTFVRLCRGNWRRGINTDEDGLIERFAFRRRHELRWDEITAVDMTDDEALLHYAGGTVRLAPPLGNWALIATLARRHLGLETDETAEAVIHLPSEQVAEWLGLAPGAVLPCRSRLAWFTGGLAAVFGLVAAAGLLSGQFALRAMALGLLGGMATWPLTLWIVKRYGAARPEYARVMEARAGGQALEVRTDSGWRTVPWGSILRTNRSIAGWTYVSTTGGDLMVPFWLTGRRRLLNAVREAIAARQAGYTLPRLTGEVPESALSPAELEVEAERGLSAAEGE
ncbi:MAG: hypothetical protein HZB16_05000 [Armatimonadetes bacterium]|nr:hypothetical protein [Armatimonadota bacterium]